MIGHRWKCGNIWSLMILIGRGLDPRNLERGQQSKRNKRLVDSRSKMLESWMCSFQGVRQKYIPDIPVAMAKGNHLFPYRTQKLSPSAPMVLGWRRPGRVGRCRIPQKEPIRLSRFFFFIFAKMSEVIWLWQTLRNKRAMRCRI